MWFKPCLSGAGRTQIHLLVLKLSLLSLLAKQSFSFQLPGTQQRPLGWHEPLLSNVGSPFPFPCQGSRRDPLGDAGWEGMEDCTVLLCKQGTSTIANNKKAQLPLWLSQCHQLQESRQSFIALQEQPFLICSKTYGKYSDGTMENYVCWKYLSWYIFLGFRLWELTVYVGVWSVLD